MKILLITFVFLLTSIVGCSSKSKKENATAQQVNANLPAKTESVPSAKDSSVVASKSTINESTSMKALTCNRDSESRNLSIVEVSPKGCQLIYSKFSPKKPVAWSPNGHKHCESVMARIKSKLEAANFKCQ
jgi:hypothetical protein